MLTFIEIQNFTGTDIANEMRYVYIFYLMDNSLVEDAYNPSIYSCLYVFVRSLGIQYKQG